MRYLPIQEIDALEHLYKINLINSCTGFKSANIIATKSKNGQENAAIFSSVTHFGSAPALLGFVLRPTTVPRNTYSNIIETGVYTINAVAKGFYKDAHHSSAKYDTSISEFDKTDLNPIYKNDFYAPFVQESPVQIAMRLEEQHPIKINGTILILGSIQGLYIKEQTLETDGYLDLCKNDMVAINGLDGYTSPNLIERLPYQRPKIKK